MIWALSRPARSARGCTGDAIAWAAKPAPIPTIRARRIAIINRRKPGISFRRKISFTCRGYQSADFNLHNAIARVRVANDSPAFDADKKSNNRELGFVHLSRTDH